MPLSTVVAADTQYSVSLPANVTRAELFNPSGYDLRIAFLADLVASPTGNYLIIGPNERRELLCCGLIAGGTIYYASSMIGVVPILTVELA